MDRSRALGSERNAFIQLYEQGEFAAAVEAGRKLLRLIDANEDHELWAAVNDVLGTALQQDPGGSKADNIEQAIEHHNAALSVLSNHSSENMWAGVHTNLGNAYLDRIRGERGENIERAIEHFHAALGVLSRTVSPFQWAIAQDGLGNSFADRLRGNRAENIEEAIRCFGASLDVHTRQDFPIEWAMSQSNLGNAYVDRIRGERAENLEMAILCYQEALSVFTREAFAHHWAAVQVNLGGAYLKRIRGDRAENVELAIDCFRAAESVFTTEAYPGAWATLQHNLGNAYSDRTRNDSAENIEAAITCYLASLRVRTRDALPHDWATTQNSLGNAFLARNRGDRAANIETGIRHLEASLEVFSAIEFPVDWAQTQNNLGNAYIDRVLGDEAANLEKAIHHYEAALTIHTREQFPIDWSLAQSNLAGAYANRIYGDRRANVERAVECYEAALKVQRPHAMPRDARNTGYAIGQLLHQLGHFADARRYLGIAHEAIESMRGESSRHGARRVLAEENAELYSRLVHSCLETGAWDMAFEYASAGKGRAFVDLLASARIDREALSRDVAGLGPQLERARDLRQEIDALWSQLIVDSNVANKSASLARQSMPPTQLKERIAGRQAEEERLWDELTFRYPTLTATVQAPTLSLSDAQILANELGACLVEYVQHAGGWGAFVVSSGTLSYVGLPLITDALLQTLTTWRDRTKRPLGQGSWSYRLLDDWHRAIFAPLRSLLPRNSTVIIAPFGQLHLFPFGAFRDRTTGDYLVDDYLLATTPSLSALRISRERSAPDADAPTKASANRLLSVAYPGIRGTSGYLRNVMSEARAISARFSPGVTRLHGKRASASAVVKATRDSSTTHNLIHFGSHGRFDLDHPSASGLALADSWLTVRRIITELQLTEVQLVSLAACETAQVDVRSGEEHVGLVHAVLSSGARSVVASLWSVNDASTNALFGAFYALFATGTSPALSLREAIRFVRELPSWKHPFYWAAFQVSGHSLYPSRSGSSSIPADVRKSAKRIHRRSSGELRRMHAQTVEDAIMLLEILNEELTKNAEAIFGGTTSSEVRALIASFESLAARSRTIRTSTDLWDLAEDIFRLIETAPGLTAWLLPSDWSLAQAREDRQRARAEWLQLEKDSGSEQETGLRDFKAIHQQEALRDTQFAAKRAGEAINHVVDRFATWVEEEERRDKEQQKPKGRRKGG